MSQRVNAERKHDNSVILSQSGEKHTGCGMVSCICSFHCNPISMSDGIYESCIINRILTALTSGLTALVFVASGAQTRHHLHTNAD